MNHPYFFHAVVPVSTVLLGFGLNATFRPDAHLAALGFPAHSEPTAAKLNAALMSIWGVRNITVGLLMLWIWGERNEALMVKALSATILLPIVDGFVSRRLIGGGELQHWAVVPIMAIMIAGLVF